MARSSTTFKKGHKMLSGSEKGWIKKGQSLSVSTQFKKGHIMPESIRRKIGEASVGRKMSIENRIKLSEARKGSKSHLWKGGVTAKNMMLRKSLEYKLWREAVFERDNYTCIECFIRGGKLNAHHIKPFAKFPELRFAIDNGVTLCVQCHKKTESYGNKKTT